MSNTIYGLNSKAIDISINLVSTYITITEDNYLNYYNAYKNKDKPEKDNFVGIVHTISGCGIIRTVNTTHNLKQNDLVFIKHNEIISFESPKGGWYFYCTWFYVKGLKLEYDKITTVPEFPNERDKYEQMINLLNNSTSISVMKGNSVCFSLILDYLEYSNFSEVVIPYKAKLDEIIEYIHGNIESLLYIEDLAEMCGFCKNHFCNLFKKYLNITPKQYIINAKLKQSIFLLLNSSLSIAEISNKLSFFSQSYYISCFKQHYHTTPAQFRKNGTFVNF